MTPGGVAGVSGGVAGISFVFSMLGQGGGMVYMPLFHWVGLSVKALAIPLGIILSATAKVFSLPQYQCQHLIDWRAAWPMMLAVLAGALLGARLTGIVPAEALIWSFALVLLLAAVRTLWVVRQPEPNTELPWVRRALLGALVAGVAGFVGGLVGIAGGFIISPVLIWMGFGSKKSAATTAAVATVSSLAGFSGHLGQMAIPAPLLIATLVAASIGSVAGSWFMAHRAKPTWIKALYGVILLGVAGQLIGETWNIGMPLAGIGLVLGASLTAWFMRSGREPQTAYGGAAAVAASEAATDESEPHDRIPLAHLE